MTIQLPVRRASGSGAGTFGGRTRGAVRPLPVTWPQVRIAGTTADLFEFDDAVDVIVEHARDGRRRGEVLGVVSLNLDHLHHFGTGRPSAGVLAPVVGADDIERPVRWLGLLDGAPLVQRAGELTGRPWPRLAGSDLIEPILDRAEAEGLSIGFLGGSSDTHAALRPELARRWPALRVAGCWAPDRGDLADPAAMAELDAEIAAAGVDIMAVCLGKPRQERWIADHAEAADVTVCLAFGAVVDFLAGRISRAPEFVASHGMEWAWRLANEPRRLMRRYLIQGPPSYRALQTDSFVITRTEYAAAPTAANRPVRSTTTAAAVEDRFRVHGPVDVAVVVVTYNNADDVEPLLASLRHELAGQRLRVVVVDNASADDTVARLERHDDVITVPTGRNLGYAGGINVARSHVGEAGAVLVLNPDLVVQRGAIRLLAQRLLLPTVSVVVPRLLDRDGELSYSLRNEPSLASAVGDALVGDSLRKRPARFSETDWNPRSYRYPHEIDWATGAAMLIDAAVFDAVGEWDDVEDDGSTYRMLHRVRATGTTIWFESRATIQHRTGSSSRAPVAAGGLRQRVAARLHARARQTRSPQVSA